MEPQDDAIAIRLNVWVADVWMFMSIPVMQLQNQVRAGDELLVFWAAMATRKAKYALIPLTCALNVPDGDERLWLHGNNCPGERVCAV